MNQAIIIIGGYNSIWSAYLSMARDLEDHTRRQVVAVPLLPWDWWSAGRSQDATNILHKLRETVVWARRKLRADRFALVGHSAGGLVARLYVCDQPVWGEVYAGADHVDTIITLGSPHCGAQGTQTGWFLSSKANEVAPGTPYSGQILYRAVAGESMLGRTTGTYRERAAFDRYRFFAGSGDLWGDGVVPVGSAGLDGSEMLILPGVWHSHKYGRNWYGGSKAVVQQWWLEKASDGA